MGVEASQELEELAHATGGSSYFSDPNSPNSILQDAFIAELQKDENEAYPIVSLSSGLNIFFPWGACKNVICTILTQFKILNPVERKPIPSGDKEEFNFRIDKTIGKDTSVMITYTDSNAPHVTLVLPDRFDAERRGMYVRYDQYKVCFYKKTVFMSKKLLKKSLFLLGKGQWINLLAIQSFFSP